MVACHHKNCTCPEASIVREGAGWCSEICADAEHMEDDREYSLCPCLHRTCENSGEYAP